MHLSDGILIKFAQSSDAQNSLWGSYGAGYLMVLTSSGHYMNERIMHDITLLTGIRTNQLNTCGLLVL